MPQTTYELKDGYRIKLVHTIRSFSKLETQWEELLQNYSLHVPFLCFDWFKIWLEHFLGANNLFILLLFKYHELVAIAPFLFVKNPYKGIVNVRQISLIGNFHSPVKNFIFKHRGTDTRREYLTYILRFFSDNFKDWDVIDLDSIPEEENSFDVLEKVIKQIGFKQRNYFCFNDWVLDEIDYSGEEYMKRRAKNLKKELRRRKRRLQERGNLRFEYQTSNTMFDYYISLYKEVRRKSWKNPEMDIAFLKDYRNFAMNRGWLRFATLFCGGSPIVCHLRLVHNNIIYFMESVYDLDFKRFSPTTILRSNLMKYVIDRERAQVIHTIRGDESYKREWTPIQRKRKGVTIFNTNSKGSLLAFVVTQLLPIIEKTHYLNNLKNNLKKHIRTF
jgi:CelD/BcsL family acetyltransferase involved in cellulose biosynthesis